ncbi:hypothetical protein CRUP_005847 [Coryphaenoides rupestris]|nr:hypothetical protein CRUP_005847 [Coryphaenoides rupestris]
MVSWIISRLVVIPSINELKIQAFVVWDAVPLHHKGVQQRAYTGKVCSSPTLSSKEKEIDDYLCQAKDKSYDTLVHFGRKGLNVAAAAAVMAASKGQGVLSERLRSFSMQDLSSCQLDSDSVVGGPNETASQHRTRTMMRSKSEGHSKGQDEFDMAEYEVLALDLCSAEELLLKAAHKIQECPFFTQ